MVAYCVHAGAFRAEHGMMVIFRTFTRVSNRCDKQNDDYDSDHSSDTSSKSVPPMGGSGWVPLCESYVNDNYLTQLDLIKRLYRIPPNDVFDVAIHRNLVTQGSPLQKARGTESSRSCYGK